jgi:hypothetical protein
MRAFILVSVSRWRIGLAQYIVCIPTQHLWPMCDFGVLTKINARPIPATPVIHRVVFHFKAELAAVTWATWTQAVIHAATLAYDQARPTLTTAGKLSVATEGFSSAHTTLATHASV